MYLHYVYVSKVLNDISLVISKSFDISFEIIIPGYHNDWFSRNGYNGKFERGCQKVPREIVISIYK